jgi:hypothetical protein
MPVYTLKLRVPVQDMDRVVVSVPERFHVGQMVTIAADSPLVLEGKDRTATLDRGESITGTVTCCGRSYD